MAVLARASRIETCIPAVSFMDQFSIQPMDPAWNTSVRIRLLGSSFAMCTPTMLYADRLRNDHRNRQTFGQQREVALTNPPHAWKSSAHLRSTLEPPLSKYGGQVNLIAGNHCAYAAHGAHLCLALCRPYANRSATSVHAGRQQQQEDEKKGEVSHQFANRGFYLPKWQ